MEGRAIANMVSAPVKKADIQESKQTEAALFQAIGVIVGDVIVEENGQSVIAIEGKQYPLLYTPHKRAAYISLLKHLRTTNTTKCRLIVYPKVTHFPKKEMLHKLSFMLVGYDLGEGGRISSELNDFEFKLCGQWQFIPVCRIPCVSVYRNKTPERLSQLKLLEQPYRRVKLLKASHVPLLWKEGDVQPFKFNPKLSKEEAGAPKFVQVIAKFLPNRDVFGFSRAIAPSSDVSPKHLKVRKEDKAEALKQASKGEKK